MERASIDNGGSNDMMSRVHNNNSSTNLTNNAWDNTIISTTTIPTTTTSTLAYGGTPYYDYTNQILFNNSTTFDNNHCMRDPHMMCLRLGKRHYCSDTVVTIPDRYVTVESSSAANKRSGKQPYPYAMTARCQVDGCHVALSNVKEYYRRHKVCEIHSKAPKVVVLGLQQRFCQQCSRFHVMSEFDEAKRSCRRRLEGHNQRRRKGTIANTLPRNFPHYHENHPMLAQQLRALPRLASPPHSKPGSALSLLSSPNLEPWMSSSGDLSSRCSAALYELIAANRATNVVGGNFLNQNTSHQAVIENTIETLPGTQMWVDSMTHITRPWHLT